METKVIPTNIKNVFNMGKEMSFDVDTPRFIHEAAENCRGGMYSVCWNIFLNLISKVAERATELNDPVLNTLMIRLNLYEIPNKERYKIIKQMKELYEKAIEKQ